MPNFAPGKSDSTADAIRCETEWRRVESGNGVSTGGGASLTIDEDITVRSGTRGGTVGACLGAVGGVIGLVLGKMVEEIDARLKATQARYANLESSVSSMKAVRKTEDPGDKIDKLVDQKFDGLRKDLELKALEASGFVKPVKPATKPEKPAPEPPKPEPPKAEAPQTDDAKWTVQLVSTPDEAEAQRIAAKGACRPVAHRSLGKARGVEHRDPGP